MTSIPLARLSRNGTKIISPDRYFPEVLAYVETWEHTGSEVIETDPWAARWGQDLISRYPVDEFKITVITGPDEVRELRPGEVVRWVRFEPFWLPDSKTRIWRVSERAREKQRQGYGLEVRRGTVLVCGSDKPIHAKTITPRDRPVVVECSRGTLSLIDERVVPGWLAPGQNIGGELRLA